MRIFLIEPPSFPFPAWPTVEVWRKRQIMFSRKLPKACIWDERNGNLDWHKYMTLRRGRFLWDLFIHSVLSKIRMNTCILPAYMLVTVWTFWYTKWRKRIVHTVQQTCVVDCSYPYRNNLLTILHFPQRPRQKLNINQKWLAGKFELFPY